MIDSVMSGYCLRGRAKPLGSWLRLTREVERLKELRENRICRYSLFTLNVFGQLRQVFLHFKLYFVSFKKKKMQCCR